MNLILYSHKDTQLSSLMGLLKCLEKIMYPLLHFLLCIYQGQRQYILTSTHYIALNNLIVVIQNIERYIVGLEAGLGLA